MTKSKHVAQFTQCLWLAAALLCMLPAVACQRGSRTPSDAASGAEGSRVLPGVQPTAAGVAGHAREPEASQGGASGPLTSSAANGGAAGLATPSAGASASFGASAGDASGAAAASSAGTAATGAPLAGASAPALISSACGAANSFTRGARIELNIAWPGTIALTAASGKVIIFSKLRYSQSGDHWLVESRPCGAKLPEITTTAVLNNVKSSNQIPASAFDSPNMPVTHGTLSSSSEQITIDEGPGLLGVELATPDAAWPAPEALQLVDHDGDGHPGVTAIPVTGDGYLVPPSSVAQTQFLDRVYVAARMRFALHAPLASCAGLEAGTVESLNFDYAIIGCHVQDGADCDDAELRFIARQSPAFKLSPNGSWSQREVPDDASCASVRAAFPEP